MVNQSLPKIVFKTREHVLACVLPWCCNCLHAVWKENAGLDFVSLVYAGPSVFLLLEWIARK
jgi:hypothetical protein